MPLIIWKEVEGSCCNKTVIRRSKKKSEIEKVVIVWEFIVWTMFTKHAHCSASNRFRFWPFPLPLMIGFVSVHFLRSTRQTQTQEMVHAECVCLLFLTLSARKCSDAASFRRNPVKLLQEFSFLILNMNRNKFGP